MGCGKISPSESYNDGSYNHFYQDINTKQFFCGNCLNDKPTQEPAHHYIFRNNKYYNREAKQICSSCMVHEPNLVKEFDNLYYCQDCVNKHTESSYSGINSCFRFISTKCKENCECEYCQERTKLGVFSSLSLLLEIIDRDDFEALLSCEDDGFKQRIQELVVELREVKSMNPKEIKKAVNEDVHGKRKVSQRKRFSRGV